ncbi:hypothetical protein HZU73_08714 [Apis mellifera caucasica]|uniref:Uncharacterized protein LOC726268 n=1 Tax=Apis mellifera TaxID=7460 RepID=A0A7M7GA19_APIME|nr:uncharacterized protein LOC726268 [Apis mellifera]KAG6796074.1 hypothetical protein HZU73_08714 [Apis mellifera caucasica]KAG9430343.1 hypothetical protein HZU67_07545 [Apis mellifera carnica]|eukprot:XP_003250814.1 uncharacterized protein LOC726268 [Apis mellifera]
MSSVSSWILVVVGLIVSIQSGSALQCWDCASNTNPLCGDPMNVTDHHGIFHVKTCESGIYDTSRKICRKIVKRENGERVVIRQCSTPNVDEADIVDGPCSATAISTRNLIECYICSTDLCNSAMGVSVTRSLFMVTLTIIGYCYVQSKYIAL